MPFEVKHQEIGEGKKSGKEARGVTCQAFFGAEKQAQKLANDELQERGIRTTQFAANEQRKPPPTSIHKWGYRQPEQMSTTKLATAVTRQLNGVVVSSGLMQKTVKVRVGVQEWNNHIKKVRSRDHLPIEVPPLAGDGAD
jgi:hypothetical protein